MSNSFSPALLCIAGKSCLGKAGARQAPIFSGKTRARLAMKDGLLTSWSSGTSHAGLSGNLTSVLLMPRSHLREALSPVHHAPV